MRTLVIADDHKIVRDGIKQILAQRDDLRIVAEAINGIEAIAATKRHKPDILLLDVSMPYASALEICVEARRWSPETRIVVFTGVSSAAMLRELIALGVDALLSKNNESSDIALAIDHVLAGNTYIQPEIQLLAKDSSQARSLSQRERQILQLIVTGNTNTQIALLLSISSKTVDHHRTNLMKKLGVHSIAELMTYAAREGLLVSIRS